MDYAALRCPLTTRVGSKFDTGGLVPIYEESTMSRALSIFLILLFWLGPLAAILPANAESRLPACCRRHGAHHCAMSMGMAAVMAEAAPGRVFLVAPSTCPAFPGPTAATTSAPHALIASSVGMPALLAHPHTPVAGRAAARLSQIRTRAGRGPPSPNIG